MHKWIITITTTLGRYRGEAIGRNGTELAMSAADQFGLDALSYCVRLAK